MKRFFSYYHPALPLRLVYMLQQVEYVPSAFFRWVYRWPNLGRVMHRKTLIRTPKAMLLVVFLYLIWLFYVASALLFLRVQPLSSVLILLVAPYFMMIWLYLVVLFAWLYIEEPRRSTQLRKATKAFGAHPATKIAVLGSYGKTTMKDLLQVTLGAENKVAATPGNQNVPISHARWVNTLDGDEDYLILEYGEGAPGDIATLAKLSSPDYAVITGIAPNHLDQYKTLDALKRDFQSIKKTVAASHIYVNESIGDLYDQSSGRFSPKMALGWHVHIQHVTIDGTVFRMKKGKQTLEVTTQLIGRHQVGAVAFAVAFALALGCRQNAVLAAVAALRPHEHRMQPQKIGGACIIDDTYNGNLEGIKAGLSLLGELEAKRKVYVTPGLVDQGRETERVHQEIGTLIAAARPDRVVLMKNSATSIIHSALKEADFKGDIVIETDPLRYYSNLEHYVAGGDIVLMQNDWTDNYY